MVDSKELSNFVASQLEGTDLFLVDVKVNPGNNIVVEIDGPQGVDIDTCVKLSRAIEEEFPREPEDYELEVGSAGLTAPFKVIGQYKKNLGQEIEVLTADGRKLKGMLVKVDDAGILLRYPVKTKVEGQKKPVMVDKDEQLAYTNIKKAQLILKF